MEGLVALEGSVLLWIQDCVRNPALTGFFTAVTTLGNAGIIWIFLTVLLLAQKKTRRIGWMCLLALAGSLVINNMILKNLVARPRPYEMVEGLMPLIARPSDYSFPSGHTGSSFAAAAVLYGQLPKKWGIAALVLAVLMGISRLYLGVHYPSDVLAGALIGSVIGLAVQRLANMKTKVREKGQ